MWGKWMWHSVFQNVQHFCTTLIKSCQILRQFKRTPKILNFTIQIPPKHQLPRKMDVSTGTPLIGRFLGPYKILCLRSPMGCSNHISKFNFIPNGKRFKFLISNHSDILNLFGMQIYFILWSFWSYLSLFTLNFPVC